jgi:uncharacterized cupin superfamily protein
MKKQVFGIVSDGDKSRLEHREIEFGEVEGVAPGGVFNAAGLGDSAVALVTFDPGFACDFHNTEVPTWMFIMHGQMDLELSDGVTQRLRPGDIVHFSDSDGQGHKSTVLGDEEVIVATAGFAG